MKWITPHGTVDLDDHELATLADAAARHDVTSGYGYNPAPGLDPDTVLAPR